jgi:hypothetical protein
MCGRKTRPIGTHILLLSNLDSAMSSGPTHMRYEVDWKALRAQNRRVIRLRMGIMGIAGDD